MEIKTKHSIPPTTIPNIGMNSKTSANVLQNNESWLSKVDKTYFLLGKWVWNRSIQRTDQKPRLTPDHYSFYKHDGHVFTKCPFIEEDVWDAMMHHFQIEVQTKLDIEKKFQCFMPQNNANQYCHGCQCHGVHSFKCSSINLTFSLVSIRYSLTSN
jgi:hypothetical protein